MSRAIDLFSRIEQGGQAAILELIATRKSEELFLDFKRSADNGAAARLHDNDRNNLAKAISGFGNSEGGIVVWGVDCARAGQARRRVPDRWRRRISMRSTLSRCRLLSRVQLHDVAVADVMLGSHLLAVEGTAAPKARELECVRNVQMHESRYIEHSVAAAHGEGSTPVRGPAG